MKFSPIACFLGLCVVLNSSGQLQAGSSFQAGANQFGDAAEIGPTGGKSDITDLSGYNTQLGEPVHRPGPNLASDKTAWWKWTAPADGLFVADTLLGMSQVDFLTDRVIDTLIAVYEGNSLNTLVPIGVAFRDRVINDLVPRLHGLGTGKTFTLPFSVDPP